MVYLDNASTTHRKPFKVIINHFLGLTKYSVNAGRGGYKLSNQAGQMVYDTRQLIAEHYNLDNPLNVIFTSSCTLAINTALRGSAKQNGHIITSVVEHNSVLRTMTDISKQYNIKIDYVKPKADGKIDVNDIKNLVQDNTYLICIIHTSNVTGNTNDIMKIGQFCKQKNIKFMTDCAQSTGHEKIDMKKMNINLLTFAGHKGFYASQGIGGLLINDMTINPIITGGTGTYSENITQPIDLPESLESGTSNLSSILTLKAGVQFVNKNFDKISKHTQNLSKILIDYLKNNDKVVLHSTNVNSGVISFMPKNVSSSCVSDYLSQKSIYVRSGLHCAPLIHKHLNTLESGMIRVSISYFNKISDIKKLMIALDKIL